MECPSCKARVRDDANYCHSCGTNLASARLAEKKMVTLEDVLSTSDARRPGHSSKAKRVFQERKEVTVLFADIANSTEIISEHDPEFALEFLDGATLRMAESVEKYGGTVSRLMGDGIIALFGAPVAVENHATHACLAALDMKEALATMRDDQAASGMGDIRVRTGISTGEVVIRAMESDAGFDFTAMGATTHLSARLEHMADPDTILCSSQTKMLTGPRFNWQPLGSTQLRGFVEPVEVFQLLSAEASAASFDNLPASNLSLFVGREKQLKQILSCFRPSQRETPKGVVIVGEAGVGKSRLCWEAINRSGTGSGRLMRIEANSYGQSIPYLPFATMLRSYFQLGSGDSESEICSKIRGRLKDLEPELEGRTTAVLSVLGVRIDDPEWFKMDSSQRQQLAHDTICRLLMAESRHNGLVVLIEDAQWIDSDSAVLLRHILSNLAGSELVFLITSRFRQEDLTSAFRGIDEITLAPLAQPSAEQLIDSCLGSDASLAKLKWELMERTSGNPFFIEESIRTLEASGVLRGGYGDFRLSGAYREIEIPSSVKSVISSRVDGLSLSDKEVLQAAAVIGDVFSVRLLEDVVSKPIKLELAGRLARLSEAQLIRSESLEGEPAYRFTHGLIHEVVRSELLSHQVAGLHRKVLTAVETVLSDRLHELTETLAHHARAGEVWDKALLYTRTAGRRAADRSAYKSAVAFFEEALRYCELVPQSAETLESAIDISFDLRNVLYPLGEIQKDLDNLQRVEELSRGFIAPERRARLSAYIARDMALLGRPDDSVSAGRRALVLARSAQDRELEILTSAYIGSAHYALGDFKQSATLLGSAIAALSQGYEQHTFGLPGPGYLFFESWRLWALARLGDFEVGSRAADEVVRFSRSLDHPLTSAVAIYSAGFLHMHRGDLEVAVPLLEEGLRICEDWDLVAWFTNLSSALGHALVLGNDPTEGRKCLEAAVTRSHELGILVSHSLEMAWLAEAALASGDQGAAESSVERALELAEQCKEWGNKAEALWTRGEILTSTKDAKAATHCYESALSLAEACNMKPLISRCQAALVRHGMMSGGDDLDRFGGRGARS